ncbi:putative transposase [Nocardia farcinica IFM 10152]|uniref:Putative transposase n=1 Tax=Nocardia farcinica (strain IFM 10152) TaxID=247156 RepID=Q5YN05_NOCFA|nr:putative transposase [Nocardia farcinica IFM 10152]
MSLLPTPRPYPPFAALIRSGPDRTGAADAAPKPSHCTTGDEGPSKGAPQWLAGPVTAAERVEAYRANALFDAHRDGPEFGTDSWPTKPVPQVSRWPVGRRGGSARRTDGGVSLTGQ